MNGGRAEEGRRREGARNRVKAEEAGRRGQGEKGGRGNK